MSSTAEFGQPPHNTHSDTNKDISSDRNREIQKRRQSQHRKTNSQESAPAPAEKKMQNLDTRPLQRKATGQHNNRDPSSTTKLQSSTAQRRPHNISRPLPKD
ncbi:hypothetical protein Ancab_022288 [Ancistrocladus abbreviatus]